MGLVVRLPVYSSGPRPSDVAQRRAREIGALGISMRVRPTLLAALPSDALHRYRVRALDTTGEMTMTLYDSGGHVAPGAAVYGGGVSFGERRLTVQPQPRDAATDGSAARSAGTTRDSTARTWGWAPHHT